MSRESIAKTVEDIIEKSQAMANSGLDFSDATVMRDEGNIVFPHVGEYDFTLRVYINPSYHHNFDVAVFKDEETCAKSLRIKSHSPENCIGIAYNLPLDKFKQAVKEIAEGTAIVVSRLLLCSFNYELLSDKGANAPDKPNKKNKDEIER